MTDFWPRGLDIDYCDSPEEILDVAERGWRERSGGLLLLDVDRSNYDDGCTKLTVRAIHVPSKNSATLFYVFRRFDSPYPASFALIDEEIPVRLKAARYEPGTLDLYGAASFVKEGRTVENEWVCETPEEFRDKLQKVVDHPRVKSRVVNLVAKARDPKETPGDESTS